MFVMLGALVLAWTRADRRSIPLEYFLSSLVALVGAVLILALVSRWRPTVGLVGGLALTCGLAELGGGAAGLMGFSVVLSMPLALLVSVAGAGWLRVRARADVASAVVALLLGPACMVVAWEGSGVMWSVAFGS